MWIQLIAAFGIGGTITKLLDIYLLSKKQSELEKETWLRDKRLEAFNEFCNITSKIYNHNNNNIQLTNEFLNQLTLTANKVILLINDKKIINRVEEIIKVGANIYTCLNVSEQPTTMDKLYTSSLQFSSLQQKIIKDFRKILTEKM